MGPLVLPRRRSRRRRKEEKEEGEGEEEKGAVIDKSLDLEKSREEMTPYFLARSRKSNFHFSFYS